GLAPKPMTRPHANAFGTMHSTLSPAVFTSPSCFFSFRYREFFRARCVLNILDACLIISCRHILKIRFYASDRTLPRRCAFASSDRPFVQSFKGTIGIVFGAEQTSLVGGSCESSRFPIN